MGTVVGTAVSDVAPSGRNNSGCILVAAAAPALYRALLMKIGVECFPSSSPHTQAYIGFHAGCPFTRHGCAFLTKGPGGKTAALFVYNVKASRKWLAPPP